MNLPDDMGTHDPPQRPAYRLPVGLPLRDEGRRQGMIVSVLVHAAIIALLLFPIVLARTVIVPMQQGAGGAGPAGGGGGGRGGETGMRDTIRFVRVAPTQVPTPTTLPPLAPPVIPKVETPVPPVTPPATKPPEQAVAPAPVTSIAGVGSGPGTGNDGTNGNGPGSGGGVGSGIGTGRGSGIGPGTGGGTQANHPPTPIELPLPPLPVPASVKGLQFIAEFDVDSTGRVLDFKFEETRDSDFNRQMVRVLRSIKFRPGSRLDGSPVRMKAQVGFKF